ncbi:hypothetical protein OROHE_023917 [Orobanche hederae]
MEDSTSPWPESPCTADFKMYEADTPENYWWEEGERRDSQYEKKLDAVVPNSLLPETCERDGIVFGGISDPISDVLSDKDIDVLSDEVSTDPVSDGGAFGERIPPFLTKLIGMMNREGHIN